MNQNIEHNNSLFATQPDSYLGWIVGGDATLDSGTAQYAALGLETLTPGRRYQVVKGVWITDRPVRRTHGMERRAARGHHPPVGAVASSTGREGVHGILRSIARSSANVEKSYFVIQPKEYLCIKIE